MYVLPVTACTASSVVVALTLATPRCSSVIFFAGNTFVVRLENIVFEQFCCLVPHFMPARRRVIISATIFIRYCGSEPAVEMRFLINGIHSRRDKACLLQSYPTRRQKQSLNESTNFSLAQKTRPNGCQKKNFTTKISVIFLNTLTY